MGSVSIDRLSTYPPSRKGKDVCSGCYFRLTYGKTRWGNEKFECDKLIPQTGNCQPPTGKEPQHCTRLKKRSKISLSELPPKKGRSDIIDL
ncbi:hypothetical protein A2686_02895 [Candidatus Woesebacteria bacterium RIFCSPHIGHO2_01_FULL_38_10]|uniref:Uncharacterized protein n=1 Tax=Candidatus Woesebacteria bacterium RIFCSPLOWO2_01_FULL_39_10b TaxID=1802517 RepID=A0A1F8B913_9BACT|nr:MAG: hypothetical protein A2686_02895 [Candidatus Woesebacteria bacterium RIFCSPHIGHO2_01_FULL_38_10]OGM60507.1 MAG: hypothetical protein A2892_00585 [Candidatus Woesebacteria bacterium RIFCSPLOWO2_01_FULL_39_10b]